MSKRTDQDTTAAIPQRTWPSGDSPAIDTTCGRSKTPSAIYDELSCLGFGAAEAGNLTAYLLGIPPVRAGWTRREIERLLFTRYLVERGWTNARAES